MSTLLLCCMTCGAATAWLAARKGYRARTWFWLGASLGLVATTILLAQPPARGPRVVKPLLFEVGDTAVGSYSFFLALGWLVGGTVFYRETRRRGWPLETMLFVMLGCVLGGVIGSALFGVLFLHHDALLEGGSFDVRLGRTVVGGIIGGFVGVEVTKKLVGYPHSTGDAFAVAIPIGHAVGRIGCLLGGCCFGTPSALPWAIRYPEGSIPHHVHTQLGWVDPGALHSLTVHPAPLYELVFDLALFAVLWRLRDTLRVRGNLFRLYLLGYASFRFLAEWLRGDTRPIEGLAIKPVQVLLLAAALYYALKLYRSERAPAPSAVQLS